MADPGAPSASIAQITTTSGLGPYTLGMPIRDKLPISAAYSSGDSFRYQVTDDSGMQEVSEGVFTSPNALTRVDLIISSTGSFISWPDTGQRIITPIVRFPICDTPPVVGQLLAWDGTNWCPITLNNVVPPPAIVCPTSPLNGQVLVWSDAENAYCPADFCALVTACLACNPNWDWNALSAPGGNTNWTSVVISNDGQKICTATNTGLFYISTDFGSSFTQVFPQGPSANAEYGQIAMSADKMIIVTVDEQPVLPHNGVSISRDGGTTWIEVQPDPTFMTDGTSTFNQSYRSCAISNDGNTIVLGSIVTEIVLDDTDVGAFDAYVYVSKDVGVTWTRQDSAGIPGILTSYVVGISGDGATAIAAGNDAPVYIEKNNFVSWNAIGAPFANTHQSTVIALNTNGDGIIIARTPQLSMIGTVNYSSDRGNTWSVIGPDPSTDHSFYGASISDDKDLIILAEGGVIALGNIWVSCDGGATFAQQSPSASEYLAGVVTPDGTAGIVVDFAGTLWYGNSPS